LPDWDELKTIVNTHKAVAAWSVELPDPHDYNRTGPSSRPFAASRPLRHPPGSAREDFAQRHNRLLATPFVVSRMVVAVRNDQGEVEAKSSLKAKAERRLPAPKFTSTNTIGKKDIAAPPPKRVIAPATVRFARRNRDKQLFLARGKRRRLLSRLELPFVLEERA